MNIFNITSRLFDLAVPTVLAQADPCTGIVNCSPDNVMARLGPLIGQIAVSIGSGVAILFIVVGGAMMICNMGNENISTKGRNAVINALVGFAILLLAQALVGFVATNAGAIDPANPIISAMATAVTAMLRVFNVVFGIMIVVAGYRMVFARGQSDQFNKGKTQLIWAIAGAIIINLAYYLIDAVLLIGL